MSSRKVSRHFHCCNDCKQSGCPGHEMELVYHNTSDTVSIRIDGNIEHVFDHTEWRVAVNLDEELRSH